MKYTPVTIIHTEEEYQAALTEYEGYFDDEPARGSPEADRFELLGMVLAKYEEERFHIPDADAVEVLMASMEANGRTQADLAELLGSRSRASEILNRKRELNLGQIKTLTREWRIPAAALIGVSEYA